MKDLLANISLPDVTVRGVIETAGWVILIVGV